MLVVFVLISTSDEYYTVLCEFSRETKEEKFGVSKNYCYGNLWIIFRVRKWKHWTSIWCWLTWVK